ncbi:aminotransferase class IV [Carboxylicivirga marina]|uniref:branched-chain-amino-acid transaminase n=1 Tax=Carboxylicivirga marina TaxID=2800988 RepID=A0ABS1HGZ6_9BACT|nr:aminotransferase class IV [Carboxylicivirga marina]MBK3516914.1 aminotransferase class IV [Carboxylicivirga marina]
MNESLYILLNGNRISGDKAIFKASNRAFKFGDALFETIRCMHQKPMWFHDHYQRLINGMSLLKMDIKSLPPASIIEEQITSLIQKNKLFGDVRTRLTIFREDGGLYTPLSNKINYLIEVSPLSSNGYQLNPKGLLLDIYEEERKPTNRWCHYKSANALLFVMAGLFKQEQKKDDVLIVNTNNQIIEGLASNLFWIKDNIIFTPMRSSACVDGIMRKQLIRILREHQYVVQEVSGTNYDTLHQADEIFLSNAIQGIQWVVGLKDKRYYCKLSKAISRLLNEDASSYMSDFQEN